LDALKRAGKFDHQ